MASDVFQHHDGVVHHEAGRDGQGHQGEIVQTVVQQIHHAEGSDQRQGDGNAGNERGAESAKKDKNHQDDQYDRYHEGELYVLDRSANCNCAVEYDIDIDRRRNGRLKKRQSGAHAIHGRDDVGARLPKHNIRTAGLPSR